MPADLKRFETLKKEVEEAEREAARAEGAYDQLIQRLRDEYELNTLKQAEIHLEELREIQEAAEIKYTTALAAFEEEWSVVFQDEG
jgi:predicted transcriptional regulator